ncbi:MULTISPECIES: hypothetical protein [unclassified Acinetobacter]|uniref:hypothetical protein n=1 Tax=unclassified Acinetobacter TaxID=196816 RepID=UPI0015D0EECC|nr:MULTISPECIES: hypothetical protein [unclassified Acinetobacter]
MRNIPFTLRTPFKNWLVKNGYRGVNRGDHMTAWKPKHKQVEIIGLQMNKPCQQVFKSFLTQYLEHGKEFLEELA